MHKLKKKAWSRCAGSTSRHFTVWYCRVWCAWWWNYLGDAIGAYYVGADFGTGFPYAKVVQLICNKHMRKNYQLRCTEIGVWWMQTFSFQVMLLHLNLNRLTTTTVCCWNFANLQWHAPTSINLKLVQELEPWMRRCVTCSISITNTLHWSNDKRCSFKGNRTICLRTSCSYREL